jgi:hypothetical protein
VEVEHTHGPNEKGADFIVTRRDEALNRNHHIGILVKIGKILSNFDDIARQIEECQMPRKIQGGKSEVRLSEVWVINNASISNNAQDKIHHKYAGQRIEFISGEKLTELVDKHASYFWHEISSDIGSYLQDLSRKIEQKEHDLSIFGELRCDEFYIDPEVQEFEKSRYVKSNKPSKPRNVHFVEEVLREKVCILEGDMGFGKSKTARHIAMHYCAPDKFKHSQVLPVFDTFSNVLENEWSLRNLLDTTTKNFFNASECTNCKVLFIIDGVDEAIGRNNLWEERLNSIIKEAQQTNGYHLLLTSRPLRRMDEQVTVYAGACRYSLRPLSIHKLIAFIEKACEKLAIPKRLFEDLQRSDLFKQLPQSPIAAALLSRLIAQNANDLPSNLTELYSKSIEHLLGRWDISKGICTEKEYKDAEQVSLDIANYLVGNQLIYMSENEARQRIIKWHSERNTNTNLNALIKRVFEKSGLFLVDSESGTLSFRHRSFGEYLFALNGIKRHKPIDIACSFDPYWTHIQFFQTGLMGDCEDHLQKLLAYQPSSEFEMWLKILLMPEYYLAGYQTRYAVVEENLYKLFIDAAELFRQISLGKSQTKLIELPEMHLLWFFQRIIRYFLGYDYFKRAIPATMLRIEQENISDEIKPLALFFAACFAAELNDGSGLEFLIKTYGAEKLPLAVSLAITIEQQSNKDFLKMPLLKEHERKLNHILKPSGDKKQGDQLIQNQAIKELFDKPVRLNLTKKQKTKPLR